MAEDERDASPKPGFDPGDSSQVRKAVEQGLVPPAPRVPAMPPASTGAKGVFVPKAPAVPARVVAARAAATPPLAPKPAASSRDAPPKDALAKGGHMHAALADPARGETSETGAVESESTGVRAAEERSPDRRGEPTPRLPIDAQRPRTTLRARPSAERVDSSELEAVGAKAPTELDDLDDDDLEPEPFANRASVDIELPEGFDDPGSHSARLSLPGPIARFGRYDVLGRLAIGGMAEIYLAQEPIPGGGIRPVVVKVLRKQLANDEDFEQLFLREGRVAMQLSHPHISTVFEFGKWGGHFFIAMEYVEGATLKDILERTARRGETALDPEVAVGIVAKVASALDYAHTARDTRRQPLGVVHRDVSPHNLMVRFDGVVKLLDFGVAKVAQSEEESRSDAVKGKFGYLSPEQCRAAPVDGRSDVFALGVCLWEALTGARLYKRGSQFDTFRAILEEPPPSVRELRPELPEELDAIVKRALAKEPSDRFASASEMQEALEAWLTTRGAVVTAARLRRTMAELFADEIRSGLRLESGPKVVERLRSTSVLPPLSTSDRPPPPDEALESTVAPASTRRAPLFVALAL
ncbi:MAG: serine/threonine protein kinase, partial [Myxococcota bacterium]|nr:serine/threonine protein kinase [Myxococcota bacterium]